MNFEVIKTITQLQTLALTLPMLVLCVMVLLEIKKPAYKACSLRGKNGERSQMCWILLGLFFGFTGKIIESIWWSIPWTMSYMEHPQWFQFNNYGVFFNVVFRQSFFTISAYCHLRAFIPPNVGKKGLKLIHYLLFSSLIIGEVYICYLWYLKNFIAN
jgi:hypothetical protein